MYNGYNKLPDTLFYAIVPAIATMSEFDMEFIGLASIEQDGELAKADMSADTRVKISVDKMIDIYLSGYPIRIVNKEDIPLIYSILDNYIQGSNNLTNGHSLNMRFEEDSRIDDIRNFIKNILGDYKPMLIEHELTYNNTDGFNLGFNASTITGSDNTIINNMVQPNISKRIGGIDISNDSSLTYNLPNIDIKGRV